MINNEMNNFLKNHAEILETGEYALTKDNVLKYIDLLYKQKKFILGGDVYYKDEKGFYPTYDNWFTQINSCLLKESINRAKVYIENYPEDKAVYFVIVI